jgi:hypothetical protein
MKTLGVDLKKYEPPLTEFVPLVLTLMLTGAIITLLNVVYSVQCFWLLIFFALYASIKINADNKNCQSYRDSYREYLDSLDFDWLLEKVEELRKSSPNEAQRFDSYITARAQQKKLA